MARQVSAATPRSAMRWAMRSGPGDDQQRSIDRLGRRALVVVELRQKT
jgi:hypothetical protein